MQFSKRSCDEGLQSYGIFVPKCSQKHGKELKTEKIFTFQGFVKKANHLACFDD